MVFDVESDAELRLCLLELFERFLQKWMNILPQEYGQLFDLHKLEHCSSFQGLGFFLLVMMRMSFCLLLSFVSIAWVETQFSENECDEEMQTRRRLQSTPLGSEPRPGDPLSVEIGFHLQATRRTVRRFLQTDTIGQLFAFAKTLVAAALFPFQDFDLARNRGGRVELLSKTSPATTLKELVAFLFFVFRLYNLFFSTTDLPTGIVSGNAPCRLWETKG